MIMQISSSIHIQACVQIFEKGDANVRYFKKGGANF